MKGYQVFATVTAILFGGMWFDERRKRRESLKRQAAVIEELMTELQDGGLTREEDKKAVASLATRRAEAVS